MEYLKKQYTILLQKKLRIEGKEILTALRVALLNVELDFFKLRHRWAQTLSLVLVISVVEPYSLIASIGNDLYGTALK